MSWSAKITALAMHGRSEECLDHRGGRKKQSEERRKGEEKEEDRERETEKKIEFLSLKLKFHSDSGKRW